MEKLLSKAKSIAIAIWQIIVKVSIYIWGLWVDYYERHNEIYRYGVDSRNEEKRLHFQANLQGDYDTFANAVLCCLDSNYQKAGLCKPKRAEDVCCSANPKSGSSVPHIDGDYNNVIFRYEVDRCVSDAHISGGKLVSPPPFPVSDIEDILNSELPKFTVRRGYGFSSLKVDDIPGNKIRITVDSVYRLPQPVQPQYPYPQTPYAQPPQMFDDFGGDMW